MRIILNKLCIINFKGIKELILNFNHSGPTNIFGANEGGKTTVADAWHWLLTNKNSNDDKDFNIKNTVFTELNRADHVVSAILIVDGNEIELKKIFREKWVKKRGAEAQEFQGHETSYIYNEVPLTQGEFQKKIADILPESALKLMTNPLYFNTIKWQDRRNVLLELAGKISNDDIFEKIARLDNKQEVANLTMVLNSGKTLQEYKAQISSKKKLIKESLVTIPPRIDEVRRAIPQQLDYNEIEQQIADRREALANLDAAINNSNTLYQRASQAVQAKQQELYGLKNRQSEIKLAENSKISNAENLYRTERSNLIGRVSNLKYDLQRKESLLADRRREKDELIGKTQKLREQWASVNEKEIKFDEHQFECPTCRRAYEAENIEAKKAEMVQNFIDDKNRELDGINSRGKALVQDTERCDQSIAEIINSIAELEPQLAAAENDLKEFEAKPYSTDTTLEELLANNDEYIQLNASISKLEAQITNVEPTDNSDLKAQRTSITNEIDALKSQLSTKDQITRANSRVAELEREEKELAQQLADHERTEFLLEEFTRAKMDILEERINGKFKYVSFKMFERQINGGATETCETMYKGVPFSDLNTAGKIWAGIDIINTLSYHYDVQAPMFLDNRESVSLIPETGMQVINLIVSPDDKQLRVA